MVSVVIETDLGVLRAAVDDVRAPRSAAHFLSYVNEGYYDGASFYRVCAEDNQPINDVKIAVVEGGYCGDYYGQVLTDCFKNGFDGTKAQTGPKQTIMVETTSETGIHHSDMTLSLGRTSADAVGDSFFICLGDQPELDEGGRRHPDRLGFSAFGRITDGSEIVRAISKLPRGGQKLREPVRILRIHREKNI